MRGGGTGQCKDMKGVGNVTMKKREGKRGSGLKSVSGGKNEKKGGKSFHNSSGRVSVGKGQS